MNLLVCFFYPLEGVHGGQSRMTMMTLKTFNSVPWLRSLKDHFIFGMMLSEFWWQFFACRCVTEAYLYVPHGFCIQISLETEVKQRLCAQWCKTGRTGACFFLQQTAPVYILQPATASNKASIHDQRSARSEKVARFSLYTARILFSFTFISRLIKETIWKGMSHSAATHRHRLWSDSQSFSRESALTHWSPFYCNVLICWLLITWPGLGAGPEKTSTFV